MCWFVFQIMSHYYLKTSLLRIHIVSMQTDSSLLCVIVLCNVCMKLFRRGPANCQHMDAFFWNTALLFNEPVRGARPCRASEGDIPSHVCQLVYDGKRALGRKQRCEWVGDDSAATSLWSQHRSHGEPPAESRLMSSLAGLKRLIRPFCPLGSSIRLPPSFSWRNSRREDI